MRVTLIKGLKVRVRIRLRLTPRHRIERRDIEIQQEWS